MQKLSSWFEMKQVVVFFQDKGENAKKSGSFGSPWGNFQAAQGKWLPIFATRRRRKMPQKSKENSSIFFAFSRTKGNKSGGPDLIKECTVVELIKEGVTKLFWQV